MRTGNSEGGKTWTGLGSAALHAFYFSFLAAAPVCFSQDLEACMGTATLMFPHYRNGLYFHISCLVPPLLSLYYDCLLDIKTFPGSYNLLACLPQPRMVPGERVGGTSCFLRIKISLLFPEKNLLLSLSTPPSPSLSLL